MGVSLIQRWGRGSLLLTWTGASGAPSTPRSSRRSDLEQPDPEFEAFGARQSQLAHLSLLGSPEPDSLGSGPSLSGDSASAAGLTLPDLDTSISGGATLLFILRLSRPDREGDWLRPLLDRPGDSPRTTSSFKVEKNPCFRSMFRSEELMRILRAEKNVGGGGERKRSQHWAAAVGTWKSRGERKRGREGERKGMTLTRSEVLHLLWCYIYKENN